MDFRVMVGKNVEPFICTRQWGWPEAKKKTLTRWTNFGLQLHIY